MANKGLIATLPLLLVLDPDFYVAVGGPANEHAVVKSRLNQYACNITMMMVTIAKGH